MNEICIREIFPGGQAAIPSFTADEGEEKAVERMNHFYRTLMDAARESGAALCRASSARLLVQYQSRIEEDGTFRIEITLRLRRDGRSQTQKILIHRWKNGWLCPPSKTRIPLLRFRRPHTGRRNE